MRIISKIAHHNEPTKRAYKRMKEICFFFFDVKEYLLYPYFNKRGREKNMPVEYERRWIVEGLSAKVLHKIFNPHVITNYYIEIKPESEIRVRSIFYEGRAKYFLGTKQGSGDAREETEEEIEEERFQELKKQTIAYIAKDRYKIKINDGLIAEINRIHGLPDFLVIEVEFPNKKTMNTFIPPKWFLMGGMLTPPKEVTNDVQFEGKNLALKLCRKKAIDYGT